MTGGGWQNGHCAAPKMPWGKFSYGPAPHQLGGMPEWMIGMVSKTIILARVSEVRILLPPLEFGAG